MAETDEPAEALQESLLGFAGTAGSPRITVYRENSKGYLTFTELLELAAKCGVAVPDFIQLIPLPDDLPLMLKGKRIYAKYCEFRNLTAGDRIYWSNPYAPKFSIAHPDDGTVKVSLDAEVLQNHEKFVHILAHEVHEITNLKELLAPTGHRGMPVQDVFDAIQPSSFLHNLDSQAWVYADSILLKLRSSQ